jgi:DNA adenine methylase
MRYMGSKSRVPLPLEILINRKPGQLYVEPFVGSGSVITTVVPNLYLEDGPRLGADKNPYVIAMLQALQSGWKAPENVTEAEYKELTVSYRSGVIPDDLIERARMGFIGCACSFGGIFFHGCFAKDSIGTINYAAQACRSLPTVEELVGIEFRVSDYVDLEIPDGSLVYCDPPYESTSKYRYVIDHAVFWKWCSALVNRNCSVFVSSYEESIPVDWRIIWKKQHYSGLRNGKKKACVEVIATK